MTTELKASTSSFFATSSPPNTIVLNGTNNFSSLRIEDPKKANLENDVYIKMMLENIPELKNYFYIVDKLGEGTFSKVFKAKLKRQYVDNETCDSGQYALKYIIPIVKPARVAKEIRFLRDLGGADNIIPIKTCFYNAGHTVIVMPIVEHDKFLDHIQTMNINEIREYMRKLLIALARVHDQGIIHRDIKPSNFLYNRASGKCALVDFGLSQSKKELCHTINYALLQASNARPSTPRSTESKSRKNLSMKFRQSIQTNENDSKVINSKRTFDEMNSSKTNVNDNSSFELSKKKKLSTEASVFISPITPSVLQDESKPSILILATPVKSRSPLKTENINSINYDIPETPVKNEIKDFLYKTPTKTEMPFNANRTPSKNIVAIPETPPKTIQKNFNRQTTFQQGIVLSNKENFQNFTTPKMASRPAFQRFQVVNRILYPELSTVRTPTANFNQSMSSNDSSNNFLSCECIDKPSICHSCLSKPELNVPRAGTPGFRAPEILLRCQNQSTKIDIWSTGVIFASLLSGRYPFFRCADDMTCLAEIMAVIGSSKMRRATAALGKTLVISRKSIPAMDLKEICIRLRQKSQISILDLQAPDSAYDLLKHLLDPNPLTRFDAREALKHEFFMEE